MTDQSLPILAHEDEILSRLQRHQVVVVVGEIGSGKTTQIPPILYRAGYSDAGRKIGVTQPRRIAAMSIAKFVAQSLNVTLGEAVGYKVRFDDSTTEGTAIKFMTDGILLREAQQNASLIQYSVIVVDEAHERNLNTDFVLGLLKDVLPRRPDLKIVVTSATIDPKKFSDYFGGAPIISVSGRAFPVNVVHMRRSVEETRDSSSFGVGESDPMIRALISEVLTIMSHPYRDDDILVFMAGEDEIDAAITKLEERLGSRADSVVLLPVYGAMMPEEQQRIFAKYPPGKRKVIFATNIAETSLTIDGIVFVIDTGRIKQIGFNAVSGVGSLDVVRHSRAGCDQRAGRAGRTKPGVCIRLYTEEDYKSRPLFTEPEIRRTDLAGVVLQMIAMGIKDVGNFDFIDPPDREALHSAHETLRALGALDEEDQLAEIGRTMAPLPLAPRLGRMLITAREKGCVMEVSTVVASLGQRSPFVTPRGRKREALDAHSPYRDDRSDFQSFLNLYRAYHLSGGRRDWCGERFIDWRIMEEVTKIHKQIIEILQSNGFELSSDSSRERITYAVASGLVENLCEKTGRHSYARAQGFEKVFIHPASSLFNAWAGRFIIASEIVTTTRCFARGCAAIEPAWLPTWLPELAPKHCRIVSKELARYIPERSVAVFRQTVYFKDNPIGEREREITLRAAHEFQKELVCQALEKKWVRLAVSVDQSGTRRAYGENRRAYAMSVINRSEPGEYYCEIEEWGGDKRLAKPKFRVINLPPLPVEPKKETERKEVAPIDPSVLKLLAEKFTSHRA